MEENQANLNLSEAFKELSLCLSSSFSSWLLKEKIHCQIGNSAVGHFSSWNNNQQRERCPTRFNRSRCCWHQHRGKSLKLTYRHLERRRPVSAPRCLFHITQGDGWLTWAATHCLTKRNGDGESSGWNTDPVTLICCIKVSERRWKGSSSGGGTHLFSYLKQIKLFKWNLGVHKLASFKQRSGLFFHHTIATNTLHGYSPWEWQETAAPAS